MCVILLVDSRVFEVDINVEVVMEAYDHIVIQRK